MFESHLFERSERPDDAGAGANASHRRARVPFRDEFPARDLRDAALIACVEQIGPEEKSVLAIACERLCELEKLTDDAIQSAAGAIKLNAKAKEKARLLLEDQKLFHSPAMAADFKHYRLLAYWDMHEAACLLLGKDPRCLQRTFLLNAAGGSPFAARFRELTGFLTRAAELGLIGGKRRIEPSRLVPWALSQGIDVPEALATTFRQPDTDLRQDLNADDLQPSRAAPSGSSTSMNTPMSPAELENKVLKATLRKERSANTTWRKTTSLIIYGLLHANLGAALGTSEPASPKPWAFSTKF